MKILRWIITVVFALAALGSMPSFSGILYLLIAFLAAPVPALQKMIDKLIPQKLKSISISKKWVKIAVAIILLFISGAATNSKNNNEENVAVDDSEKTIYEESVSDSFVQSTENHKDICADNTYESDEQTQQEASKDSKQEAETDSKNEKVNTNDNTPPETVDECEDEEKADENSFFEIRFFDVGQADSALINCDNHYMLIDGGNKGDSSLLYSYLSRNNIEYLDVVIATHAHEDHIGGIPGALRYASAGVVYTPVLSYESDAFDDFVSSAENLVIPQPGDSFKLGSSTVQIIACNSAQDTNNTSIVCKIVYEDTSFLFTGDAEREAEQVLLNSGYDLSADVLKVGHHGSDSSTTYPFLREIMPEYAVISVGKDNSYGHPDENTLSRLRDANVKVFRTDFQGDIVCRSDGQTLSFSVDRNVDMAESINTPDDKQPENITNREVAEEKPIEPTVTLFAADGRTIDVLQSEVDAYLAVGWYATLAETQQTMYATDGRQVVVYKSEVESYKNAGWYETASQAQAAAIPQYEPETEEYENYSGDMVWIPQSGKKYHSYSGCSNMKNPSQVTQSQAESMGFTPCKKCY